MKLIHFLIIFILFPFVGSTQILDSLDTYDHKEFENQTLKVFSDSGVIQLQVIASNVIKVSFSKKENIDKHRIINQISEVDVRITQNLESIFMQTLYLIVVINKLNFSIKFLNRQELPYTTNHKISFLNDCINTHFSVSDNESLSKKRLKEIKILEIRNPILVYSSKKYSLYYEGAGNLTLRLQKRMNLEAKFCDSEVLEYYFFAGSLKNKDKDFFIQKR